MSAQPKFPEPVGKEEPEIPENPSGHGSFKDLLALVRQWADESPEYNDRVRELLRQERDESPR